MAPSIIPPSGKPAEGETVRLDLERIGAQGKAVASLNGFTMLVPRGVAGEQVEARVERVHARYGEARTMIVLRPAPERVSPPCPHFEQCGGCDWQHVDYAQQLEYKRRVLADQLARIGRIDAPAEWRIVPCEQTLAYRDKLEFTLAHGEGGAAVPGFHGVEEGPPVPIEHCHLAPESFTRLAREALLALAELNALAGLNRLTVQGCGDDGLALLLHLHDAGAAQLLRKQARSLVAHLEAAVPELRTLALSLSRRKGTKHRSALHMLKGPALLTKQVRGRPYRVPINGFFQVNLPQAARLAARVTEIIAGECAQALASGKPPLAMDLFCGAGLHAMPLAQAGFRVAGAELAPQAVRAARETAKLWKLPHCSFQATDLARPGALQAMLKRHGPAAAMVANPPRAGLPRALGEALLAQGPPLLVYVSCDGGTFARDAARLAPAYELAGLEGFDLFPQTHHLEILGIFTRRAWPAG
ncbi:MAG: 23S rRNA (uracil(1939)-C(5))-methyltransferase RlmD [SAR324 cluster bacterium]|nr:23S rRNA (uracil(1939)-C(5))-methyltransferase RlmD [SAR324 cluster bacterium]